ncbi:hypothetical protein ACWDZ4_20315 [Streptomyces sp. NPDC003016]
MTKGWGRTAASALLAAAVLSTAGCGGGEADAKTPASPSPSVSKLPATVPEAARLYQEDLRELQIEGCPADCGLELTEVYNNAALLRKTMRESDAPLGTFTGAYRAMDALTKGYVLHGQGEDTESTRPLVLGPAYELNDWLTQNPVE